MSTYEYYKKIFAEIPRPFALVDLDMLDDNAQAIAQAARLPSWWTVWSMLSTSNSSPTNREPLLRYASIWICRFIIPASTSVYGDRPSIRGRACIPL
ncbi:hypothetical protein [Paenibacillus lautus]|uniref:hypothetical protein n=1 Tax=Paenibacillus lautus TaxID=1401 RepID=UPI001FECC218|nr:hypothetical protein [Paenibacillus lautus]